MAINMLLQGFEEIYTSFDRTDAGTQLRAQADSSDNIKVLKVLKVSSCVMTRSMEVDIEHNLSCL
jgi:hypothetical protein